MRLLVTSILIALCSIATTAWLAVSTTTEAIQQQPAQALADDATIYNTLLGYAATHPSWDGVRQTVLAAARHSGRGITLTTTGRRLIATSTAQAALPGSAFAMLSPLQVNQSLVSDQGTGNIDPRAVGPFRLPSQQRATLLGMARKTAGCLRGEGFGATVSASPSGHPFIAITGSEPKPDWSITCNAYLLLQPTATEHAALTQLSALVNHCLSRAAQAPVVLHLDFTWVAQEHGSSVSSQLAQSCIDASRRRQLSPYVAPPAMLFITGRPGTVTTRFELSAAGRTRIVWATLLVLALTVAVTVVVSGRLVKPLITLTDAVQDSAQPRIRVPVTSGDEIGRLTAAYNDLSERRERLEAQRTAMVSDIAHELRTPLGNIRGWLEAAEDGLAAPDQAFMSSLLEEAVLLQRVIDDLQDLAAADAGQLRLHRKAVHVRDLLDQVAAARRAAAGAAGLLLAVRAEEDPEIFADPVRLRQAIGNLVSNALRYTPAGGSIILECRQDRDQVVIEVTDSGSGISAEDLPRIFDRFWRAEKSRSRRTGGSGLGLPITRQLIEAHGGTVTVASVPGERTVFTVRLPR